MSAPGQLVPDVPAWGLVLFRPQKTPSKQVARMRKAYSCSHDRGGRGVSPRDRHHDGGSSPREVGLGGGDVVRSLRSDVRRTESSPRSPAGVSQKSSMRREHDDVQEGVILSERRAGGGGGVRGERE